MSRSSYKPPFSEIKLKNKQTIFKIWSRRSIILPFCLNKKFLVYNGKNFIPVTVSTEMIGHKFGEFSNTRKKTNHNFKQKNQKRK